MPDEFNTPQAQFWMQHAQAMLPKLDKANATLEWLSFSHNAVFTVQHSDDTFILRLHKRADEQKVLSEVALLRSLGAHNLNAPVVVQTATSDQAIGILQTYLTGDTRTPDTVTETEMHAIGDYLARLHKSRVSAPHRPTLDFHGLFNEGTGVYYPGADNMQIFSPMQRRIMETASIRVQDTMRELRMGNDEFGIIHADCLLKNILFNGDMLYILDWEYSGAGYYLYDLTPVLWQLKPHTNYDAFEQAVWDGYTAQRPLTARHRELLGTLIVGRHIASMLWIAANQQNPYVQGKVDSIIAQRTTELQNFLDTENFIRS